MSGARFITFEGIEGCGKSTQIARLHAFLQARGATVERTREPGGTPLGEQIRSLLLHGDDGSVEPLTEMLLFAAARAQHVRRRIAPVLAADRWVLSDRFVHSSLVYQGIARGLGRAAVRAANDAAVGAFWPDAVIVLDLPVDDALRRVSARGAPDRFEREARDFHERLRAGFLAEAALDDRVRVVDAVGAEEIVEQRVRGALGSLLP